MELVEAFGETYYIEKTYPIGSMTDNECVEYKNKYKYDVVLKNAVSIIFCSKINEATILEEILNNPKDNKLNVIEE